MLAGVNELKSSINAERAGIGSLPSGSCDGPCGPGVASPVAVNVTVFVAGFVVTAIPVPPTIVSVSDSDAATTLFTCANAFWFGCAPASIPSSLSRSASDKCTSASSIWLSSASCTASTSAFRAISSAAAGAATFARPSESRCIIAPGVAAAVDPCAVCAAICALIEESCASNSVLMSA